MPASKAYSRVDWKDYPNKTTKIKADNLNKMDKGIDDIDDRVVSALNSIDTISGKQLTDEANILTLQGDISALNGFRFYPAGTAIVGLVADDSPYTDADGNYILAESATGQAMIDGVTYKSINSTEDTRGKVGADTASPFKKELKKVLVEKVTAGWNDSTKTVDCTSIPNYQELTVDNFTYEYTSITGSGNGGSASCNPSMSYNSSTGVLTLTGLSVAGSGWNGISSAKIDVYCYYIE